MFDVRNQRGLPEIEKLAQFRRIREFEDKHGGKYTILAAWGG